MLLAADSTWRIATNRCGTATIVATVVDKRPRLLKPRGVDLKRSYTRRRALPRTLPYLPWSAQRIMCNPPNSAADIEAISAWCQ
jgi:hypothetical protein